MRKDYKTYIIKHGTCCGKTDTEEIEGSNLMYALRDYADSNLPIYGSCDITVTDDDGVEKKFCLSKSISCDVWEES